MDLLVPILGGDFMNMGSGYMRPKKKHLQLCPKHSRYRFSVAGGDKNRRDFPFLAGYVHEMCRGSRK